MSLSPFLYLAKHRTFDDQLFLWESYTEYGIHRSFFFFSRRGPCSIFASKSRFSVVGWEPSFGTALGARTLGLKWYRLISSKAKGTRSVCSGSSGARERCSRPGSTPSATGIIACTSLQAEFSLETLHRLTQGMLRHKRLSWSEL